MKYFATNSAESVVLFGRPSAVMQREIAERLLWVLDFSEVNREFWLENLTDFVFNGKPIAARTLSLRLHPAAMRLVISARIWYKEIEKDMIYHSSDLWTRKGDAVIQNLNIGRCVVLVDGHYWVN
ncbi:TPA_asm: hypothetical protein [ssRNA phage Zoerhiza.1_29]|uniref:Uncharacterized protein n=2 Tax=Fiersviridae TaxID=2842319 RepID=A0A8S5L207_9VIRU|nr:hypothetical protein QIL40_gp1 [ssRNA phage Zoerhiza.1_29]QDH89280.1 MAG: hypothetical protein H1Rhizo26FD573_000004 [Leviviridae sp.]DAD51447.1 TPA_asm: hypothetical protein [ssRNA phage Zoerhiza.1_29]